MSDWQVGDLAVCIGSGTWIATNGVKPSQSAPEKNGVYRVSLIERDLDGDWLGLKEHPEGTWAANKFRKIRPDEHEACEPEFVTLLKRTKVAA